MKYIAIITGFLIIGCESTDNQQTPKLETAMDSVSYSIGVDIGKNMKTQELDINDKAKLRSLKDVFKQANLALVGVGKYMKVKPNIIINLDINLKSRRNL